MTPGLWPSKVLSHIFGLIIFSSDGRVSPFSLFHPLAAFEKKTLRSQSHGFSQHRAHTVSSDGGSVLKRGEKRDWLKVLIFAMKTLHCKSHVSISSQLFKKTSLLVNERKLPQQSTDNHTNNVYIPEDPCMVYLPTFGICLR